MATVTLSRSLKGLLIVEGLSLAVRPELRPAVELVKSTMEARPTGYSNMDIIAFLRRFKRTHDIDAIQDMDLVPLVRQQLIREGLLDG